jgi:hypothetical protein
MEKRSYKRRLSDAYRFAGFRTAPTVTGIFGDSKARLVQLFRRSKKRFAAAAERRMSAGMTIRPVVCAIFPAATPVSIWPSMFAVWPAGVAER